MATRSLETQGGTRNRASYPTAKHPQEVDPADCPEIYASGTKGKCLEPVFADGTCLVFSSAEECRPGDFVGFWLHPDIPHAHELPRRVKRLKSALPAGLTFPYQPQSPDSCVPIIELEQFNPPRTLRVPATHIIGMHRVIGTAIPDTNGQARFYPSRPYQVGLAA